MTTLTKKETIIEPIQFSIEHFMKIKIELDWADELQTITYALKELRDRRLEQSIDNPKSSASVDTRLIQALLDKIEAQIKENNYILY